MAEINMHAAKSNLSKIVADAENGEETTLCRAGKPVARIIAAQNNNGAIRPRAGGLLKGQIELSADFDDLSPAASALFGIPETLS